MKTTGMKNMIRVIVLAGLLAGVSSCKKEFDLPPAVTPPADGTKITIDSIRKKFVHYYMATVPTPEKIFRFTDNANLECTVTADESSGNIYKQVFVDDGSGGLVLKLVNAGGLAVGDKIRINLNGVILNDYAGVIQLDSVDIEKRVVKISSGNVVTPMKITMNALTQLDGNGMYKYQSRLVMLDTVEFVAGQKGLTYADPVNKVSFDRTLVSAGGSNVSAVVRTSGYANFAGSKIPCGRGSIIVVVGQYNMDLQLTVRNPSEIRLSNDGCPTFIKTFDDQNLLSGGWKTYNVSGSVNWKIGSYSGQIYGEISNYSGGNVACETWLISPPIDIAEAVNPRLIFQSAYNYTGPALEVLVSTDYTSGNPTLATWTTLSPALSPGGWEWISSGNVSLTAHKSAKTVIAFKYTGTSSSGSTWEIDDIAVMPE